MPDWTTPSFASLPEAAPGWRWVGSRIMDEEQYRIEGWKRQTREVVEFDEAGHASKSFVTYWTGTLDGYRAYSRLRAGRKATRKRRWQEREEEEQAYTDWVNEQAAGR